MIINPNLSKASAYIESQIGMLHSQSAGRTPTRQSAVTISRQTGTRGFIIGRKLVNYLRYKQPKATPPWTFFDKDLIERVLEDHDLPSRLAKFMPEDRVNEVQSTIEEIFGLHPSSWTLLEKTKDTIIRLGEIGNVVIFGRGSNLITSNMRNVVNVRLIGSIELRIRQTAKQFHISEREAQALVNKEDGGRRRYIKTHFNDEIDNPLLYDLIINNDRLTDKTVVRMISDLALRRRRRRK